MSMQEKSNNLAGAINAAGKPLELKMSNPNDLLIVRRGDVEALKQEAIFGVFRRDAVEFDKLNALLSNAKVASGEPIGKAYQSQSEHQEHCCPECGCHFVGEYPFEYHTKQAIPDGWISVKDRLPNQGDSIEGLNDFTMITWSEVFDSTEPSGYMTHWRVNMLNASPTNTEVVE